MPALLLRQDYRFLCHLYLRQLLRENHLSHQSRIAMCLKFSGFASTIMNRRRGPKCFRNSETPSGILNLFRNKILRNFEQELDLPTFSACKGWIWWGGSS